MVRSCGKAIIDENCESQIVGGKNNNQEMKVCFSSCIIDGCNQTGHLKSPIALIILCLSLFISI